MIIIGHRGASGNCAENTRSAFLEAIKLNLKMLEFDVQITKDGVLVLSHDYNMFRQTGVDMMIKDSTYDALLDLNMAHYKPELPKEKILTLDEVFEIVPDDVMLNIEIKNMPYYQNRVVSKLLESIEKYNRHHSVLVSSFDHHLLSRLYQLDSSIKIGVLTYANLFNMSSYINNLNFKVYSVHMNYQMVKGKVVEELINSGYKVYVWTVNTNYHYRLMQQMGVSGIFTDYPEKYLGRKNVF